MTQEILITKLQDQTITNLYDDIARTLQRYREVYNAKRITYHGDDHVTLTVQCEKYGDIFFRVPPEHEEDDWDWPDFVGRGRVESIIDNVFRRHRLSRDDFKVEIWPQENGIISQSYNGSLDTDR